jgi:hypothetical protein
VSKRSGLAEIVIALVALIVPWLWGQPVQPPDLPLGDMQGKARTACLECHDARIILQQRLSKATWMKEVDKMTKWGAVVDPADRDALIEYLSVNFPADKAPQPAARVPGQKKR